MSQTIYSIGTDKEKHEHYCPRCSQPWKCAGRRDFCGCPDKSLCAACIERLDKSAYTNYILETIAVRPRSKPEIIPISAEELFS